MKVVRTLNGGTQAQGKRQDGRERARVRTKRARMRQGTSPCELTRPQTTGESSPGPAAPGAQPSSGMWQMPHTSSSVVHVQLATACQFLMVT